MGRQETGIALDYGYGPRIVDRQETLVALHYGYGAITAPHLSVCYILALRFGSRSVHDELIHGWYRLAVMLVVRVRIDTWVDFGDAILIGTVWR